MCYFIKTFLVLIILCVSNGRSLAAFPVHVNIAETVSNNKLALDGNGLHVIPAAPTEIIRPKHKGLAVLLSIPFTGGFLGLGRLYMGYYVLGSIELLFFLLLFTSVPFLVTIGVLGMVFNFAMGIADVCRILQVRNRHGRARELLPKNGAWAR